MRFLTLASLLVITCFAGSSPAKGQVPTKLPAKPPGKVSAVVKKLADTAATTAAGMAADSLLGDKGRAVTGALMGTAANGQGPSCPEGTVAVASGQAGAALGGVPGIPGGMPSPGAALVTAAKQAAKGKDAPDSDIAPAVGPQVGYTCLPTGAVPGMPGAAAMGNPTAAMGSPLGAMAAATPVGMAVMAAPAAGKAAKGLKGMLGGKPQDKIAILRDLGQGRVELKGARFIEGTAELEPGYEESFAALGEALALAEGTYLLHVAAEQNGKNTPPDTALARKRLEKAWATLLVNGVSDQRVIAVGELPAELQAGRKPRKPGEARVELIRAPSQP